MTSLTNLHTLFNKYGLYVEKTSTALIVFINDKKDWTSKDYFLYVNLYSNVVEIYDIVYFYCKSLQYKFSKYVPLSDLYTIENTIINVSKDVKQLTIDYNLSNIDKDFI